MNEPHPRDIDISTLTLAEVEALIAATEEDLAAMQAKIDQVKANRVQTGEFADAGWYARINAARRFAGQRHQALLRRAAVLRREERQARAGSFEQAFVAAAKEQLPADTFAAIVAAARSPT